MKNKLFLIGIVLVLSSVCVGAALISENEDIEVTLISQDPDPVNPGEWVDLRWKVENLGIDSAKDFEFEIIPDYPFSLYSGELTRDLGTIAGRQMDEKGVIVHYKIKVDEGAVEGLNEIKVRYKWGIFNWVTSDAFYIRIQTVDATLSLEEVSVLPEMVVPGDKAKISIKLKNLADSVMEDISFKLDLSSATLPLAPIGSATEKKIRMLNSGEEVELVFDIISDPSAESGVYKIPISITYYDELETKYNKSDIITAIIGSKPDLSINLDTATVLQAGKSGEVTIRFVNKGISDVKFLDVKLGSRDDYEILSPDYVYLGNIDSDDYETADFRLWIKPTKAEELILPLHIEYKDANNNDYVLNKEIALKIYGSREAKKLGLMEEGSKVGIFIVVIIVIGGVIAYRVIRKRKKK